MAMISDTQVFVSVCHCKSANPLLVQEVGRDMWRWISLEHVWQDIRYGARLMAQAPTLTLIIIVTLAMGVGATAAILAW